MDRYSPMFDTPSTFGIRILGASESERWLHNNTADADKVSYYFEYEYAHDKDQQLVPYWDSLHAAVSVWIDTYRPNSLTYVKKGSELIVRDFRTASEGNEIVLTGMAARLMEHCRDGASTKSCDSIFPVSSDEFQSLQDLKLVALVDNAVIALPVLRDIAKDTSRQSDSASCTS